MERIKFLIFVCALFVANVFFLATGLIYAQESGPGQQTQPSRDIDAAIQHRRERVITQQQREEAAARAKSANPELAARIAENRSKLLKARDARVAELELLNDTTITVVNNDATISSTANSNVAPLKKSKRGARRGK